MRRTTCSKEKKRKEKKDKNKNKIHTLHRIPV
jgi:hypothetical protein